MRLLITIVLECFFWPNFWYFLNVFARYVNIFQSKFPNTNLIRPVNWNMHTSKMSSQIPKNRHSQIFIHFRCLHFSGPGIYIPYKKHYSHITVKSIYHAIHTKMFLTWIVHSKWGFEPKKLKFSHKTTTPHRWINLANNLYTYIWTYRAAAHPNFQEFPRIKPIQDTTFCGQKMFIDQYIVKLD